MNIPQRAKQLYDSFSEEYRGILDELETREQMVYFIYCLQNCLDIEHVFKISKRELEKRKEELRDV